MLCSAKELDLSDEASGCLHFRRCSCGPDLREYLGGDDWLIRSNHPNRGDCLSILGVARELAALYDKPLTKSDVAPVKAIIKDSFPVDIQAGTACPGVRQPHHQGPQKPMR